MIDDETPAPAPPPPPPAVVPAPVAFDSEMRERMAVFEKQAAEYAALMRTGSAEMSYTQATGELDALHASGDMCKVMFICETSLTADVISAWFKADMYSVLTCYDSTTEARAQLPLWRGWCGDVIVTTMPYLNGITVPEMVHTCLETVASYWRITDKVVDYDVAIANRPPKYVPPAATGELTV
jgi:hypothetical protein